MKQSRIPSKSTGFTVIELLVVIVVLLILGTLVALTYSGVRAKNHNGERQAAINSLQGQLETFYAQANAYPAQADLNSTAWRQSQLKRVTVHDIKDPSWRAGNTACSQNRQPVTAAKPTAGCYSYQVTAADGAACDNIKAMCAHYTLTAVPEGGGNNYVKTSLN